MKAPNSKTEYGVGRQPNPCPVLSSGRWEHLTQTNNTKLPYPALAEAHQIQLRLTHARNQAENTTKANQGLKTMGYLEVSVQGPRQARAATVLGGRRNRAGDRGRGKTGKAEIRGVLTVNKRAKLNGRLPKGAHRRVHSKSPRHRVSGLGTHRRRLEIPAHTELLIPRRQADSAKTSALRAPDSRRRGADQTQLTGGDCLHCEVA